MSSKIISNKCSLETYALTLAAETREVKKAEFHYKHHYYFHKFNPSLRPDHTFSISDNKAVKIPQQIYSMMSYVWNVITAHYGPRSQTYQIAIHFQNAVFQLKSTNDTAGNPDPQNCLEKLSSMTEKSVGIGQIKVQQSKDSLYLRFFLTIIASLFVAHYHVPHHLLLTANKVAGATTFLFLLFYWIRHHNDDKRISDFYDDIHKDAESVLKGFYYFDDNMQPSSEPLQEEWLTPFGTRFNTRQEPVKSQNDRPPL